MDGSPGSPAPLNFYRSSLDVPVPVPRRCHEAPATARHLRKPFIRRRGDAAQRVRGFVQLGFAAVAAWVGVEFYFWVRYYETAGQSLRVSRPPGVEAWLPIAALMNTKAWLATARVPEIHPAGMIMLIAFLAISILYRKAFCSWICPVGTISEHLWRFGDSVFGRTLSLPRWIDTPLRGLKYLLLGLFLYVVVSMPVPEIEEFLTSPYGLVADVKMLDFFRRMGQATAAVLMVLIVGSIVVKNLWCRMLCPYGALMGLAALASPTRIRRNPDACIDCGKCAAACPSALPVDTALSIGSAECSACLSCVSVCPAVGALDLTIGYGRQHAPVPAWSLATAILAVFLGLVGGAWATGHWHTDLPDHVYFELIPRASGLAHPR